MIKSFALSLITLFVTAGAASAQWSSWSVSDAQKSMELTPITHN